MGIAKDEFEAVKWFRKAAENGHAGSQYMLGKCYLKGTGITENRSEAIKWLVKAARKNDKEAKKILNDLGESW